MVFLLACEPLMQILRVRHLDPGGVFSVLARTLVELDTKLRAVLNGKATEMTSCQESRGTSQPFLAMLCTCSCSVFLHLVLISFFTVLDVLATCYCAAYNLKLGRSHGADEFLMAALGSASASDAQVLKELLDTESFDTYTCEGKFCVNRGFAGT
jgi:hypothetical protein